MPTNTDTSRGLARHVSESLKAAGFTQREAAKRTGLKLSTLNSRLTGNTPLDVVELDLIADLLDVKVSDLIERAS